MTATPTTLVSLSNFQFPPPESDSILPAPAPPAAPAPAAPASGISFSSYRKPLPSMRAINDEVPIEEAARLLGLRVNGKKTRCPACHKERLTLSKRHNVWRCWECDPEGKRRTPIDLVMFCQNVTAREAALWLHERWHTPGRVRLECSENKRGLTKHLYMRWRCTPIAKRDKPNLESITSSPGWPDLPPCTAKVIRTLLSMLDSHGTVTIARGAMKERTGFKDSHKLARANRDIEAIGLFAVDRGYCTEFAKRPTIYRLTWYSVRFQHWLATGETGKDAASDTAADVPSPATVSDTCCAYTSTSIGVRFLAPTEPGYCEGGGI